MAGDGVTQQIEPASVAESPAASDPQGSFWEVLGVASRLGVSCFGGPIAHLGYFRDEYVL